MSRYSGESDYAHARPGGVGVLLSNLGTPAEPESAAVRRWLAEFLWDPRVVEIPRPLWWLILHGLILRTRPARSAAAYRKVWTEEGSPLLVISRNQREALAERLSRTMPGFCGVELGMRYGEPSIPDALQALRARGARRILVLPLYPQYSGTTTASTFDAVSDCLRGWRWLPDLRFVMQYHDHPGYIEALANSIRDHWSTSPAGERLLFSFHGLPRRNLTLGDPYHCQCHKTARLVAEALGLAPEAWGLSFQSRLGRAEWLQPYTDRTLHKWAAEDGLRAVDVVCPGFSADCLETLEEIVMQNGDGFRAAGGEVLRYIPALNERAEHIDFLAGLVAGQTQGWPEADPAWSRDAAVQEAERSARRAATLMETGT